MPRDTALAQRAVELQGKWKVSQSETLSGLQNTYQGCLTEGQQCSAAESARTELLSLLVPCPLLPLALLETPFQAGRAPCRAGAPALRFRGLTFVPAPRQGAPPCTLMPLAKCTRCARS